MSLAFATSMISVPSVLTLNTELSRVISISWVSPSTIAIGLPVLKMVWGILTGSVTVFTTGIITAATMTSANTTVTMVDVRPSLCD